MIFSINFVAAMFGIVILSQFNGGWISALAGVVVFFNGAAMAYDA